MPTPFVSLELGSHFKCRYNIVSQGFYDSSGRYASDTVVLDGWTTAPAEAYPVPGSTLRRSNINVLFAQLMSAKVLVPDANTVYILAISNVGVEYELDGSCGWHSVLEYQGTNVPVIVAHNSNNFYCGLAKFKADASVDLTFPYTSVTQHAQGLASTIALQLAATVTNKNGDGWNSGEGSDLADACTVAGALVFSASKAAHTLTLGPTQTLYIIPQLLDPRSGKCAISGAANAAGQITCTSAFANHNCTSDFNCTAKAGTSCVSGFCSCPVGSCIFDYQCVAFPTPASVCESFAVGSNEIVVVASPIRMSERLRCFSNNGVPSVPAIYCMSNGLWNLSPHCIYPTSTSTTTTSTTTTTTASHCPQFFDCASCSAQADCGWCATTQGGMAGVCLPGLSEGSSDPNAPNACANGEAGYWNWFSGSCAQTSTTTTTTPTTTATVCTVHSDCSSCTASSNCGWCSNSAGSSSGTCYLGGNGGALASTGAPAHCQSGATRYWYRVICPQQCIGAFSQCSLFCGLGNMTYLVSQPVARGGVPCPYTDGTVLPCNRKNCLSCAAYQFQFHAPTPTTDRVCHNISSCTAAQYQSAAPTTTTDRVCTPISSCDTTYQFQSIAPTTTSNRVCTQVTYCNSTQYETVPPTATADRICAPIIPCTAAPTQLVSNGVVSACTTSACSLTCNSGYAKTGDFSCIAGAWNAQYCADAPYIRMQGAPIATYNQIYQYSGVFNDYPLYMFTSASDFQAYIFFTGSKWCAGLSLESCDMFLTTTSTEPFESSSLWTLSSTKATAGSCIITVAVFAKQFRGAFGTAYNINNVFVAFGSKLNGQYIFQTTWDGAQPKYYFYTGTSHIFAQSLSDTEASPGTWAIFDTGAHVLRTNALNILQSPVTGSTVFSDTCTSNPTLPLHGNLGSSCAGLLAGSSCALSCGSGYFASSDFTCIAGHWDLQTCLSGCGTLPSTFASQSCAGTQDGGSCSASTLCAAGTYAADDFYCHNGTWTSQECATCPYLRITGSSVADGFYEFLYNDDLSSLPVYRSVSEFSNSTSYLYGSIISGSGASAKKEWRFGDGDGSYESYAPFTSDLFPYQTRSWYVHDGAAWVLDLTVVTCACPVLKIYSGSGADAFLNGIFALSSSDASVYENVLDISPLYLQRISGAVHDNYAITDVLNGAIPFASSNGISKLTSDQVGIAQVVWTSSTIQGRSICPLTSCTNAPSAPAFGSLSNGCSNVASGGTCTFTCQSGYTPSNAFMCQAGVWSNEACLPSCGLAPNVTNVQLTVSCTGKHSGQTCSYTCNTGYISTATHFTCINGAWDAQGCVAVPCSQVQLVASNNHLTAYEGIYKPTSTDQNGNIIYALASNVAYLYLSTTLEASYYNVSLGQAGSWVVATSVGTSEPSKIIAFALPDPENPSSSQRGPYDVFSGDWYVPSSGGIDTSVSVFCKSSACGASLTVTTNGSVITTGLGTYKNNVQCDFYIFPPAGLYSQVTFSYFDLQKEFDFLFAYEGNTTLLVTEFSGYTVPSDFISALPFLRLSFVSDATITKSGFSATVHFIQPPTAAAITTSSIGIKVASAGSTSDASTIGAIVGPVVAGVIILAVICIVLYVRRSNGKHSS